MKWLIYLLIFWLLWRFFTRAKRQRANVPPRSQSAERMVRCAQCNVGVPESEALTHQGRFYCSREHAPHSDSSAS